MWNFSHSCLIYDFSCSTVQGLRCHILPFKKDGCCWYMAFALHCRVLTCIGRCSDELCSLTVLFRCVPEAISLTEWCWLLMQCRMRDQRSQAFNVGFWPCRLHAEISPDSLNLLMILWTVDDEIPQFLAIVCWETLFLNCKTICSRSGEPCPILACEPLSLSGMLLLYLIIALTCFQLTGSPVECSKQVFFKRSSTFPVFCCPRPSHFRMCCRHLNKNERISAQKQYSLWVWTLHILSLLFIQLNFSWKGFATHCIPFYKTSQLHWNWGLYLLIILFKPLYSVTFLFKKKQL